MIYKGKVVAIHERDPRALVRVVVPQTTGSRTQTARLAGLPSVAVGDSVWVAYEAGDFSQPVVISHDDQDSSISPVAVIMDVY